MAELKGRCAVIGGGAMGRQIALNAAINNYDVIVCENKYRRLNCDQLRLMVSRSVKDKDHNEWVKAFCNRKYNSDFSIEMSRSVAEYLKEYI